MTRRTIRLALLAATVSATPALAQERPAEDDNTIVVTGERPLNDASAGTKTDTPIASTPQSISVISSAEIAGLGLQNLNQALRYVAGVTPEQRGSSAEVYDLFKLRGFDAPLYLDGLRQFASPTGYSAPQVDVSRLDRLEVIKGPASVLYGQSSPGGLVAQASKLPLDRDLYGAISGTYGTYDLYRVDADIGGRIDEGALWRLYGSVNGASTQQRFGKRERQTVSGAVTAGAGSDTSFTVLAAYSHDPYNGTYGVFPALGTLRDNPNGQLSTRFDGGEAGNRFRREQAALTYIFTHDFGGDWVLRSSGRYQYVSSDLGLLYVSGAAVPDGTFRNYYRASYATDEALNNWTFDTSLGGKLATGPVEHSLLLGVDRQVAHASEVYAFGSAPSLDVYDPVYGTVAVPRTPAQVPDAFGGAIDARQRQQGVYAQDQMRWGGLNVVLSGRHDWARDLQVGGAPAYSRKFTYRVGALYTTSLGIAPYVSYSTSFQPQSGTVQRADGSFGLPDPSLGKQIEAGAKYAVPGTPILLTGAWFRIEQTNVLTSTPDFSVSYQSGKVRSEGVEFEAVAPLPYGFNARAAFSRQRVRVIEDADPARVGKSLETVGRGGVSATLDWTPRDGALHGLTLGGGVRHVDRVYAGIYAADGITTTAATALYSPSYTLVDALARYDLERVGLRGMSIAINAANIFDKRYLTSCYANYNWCWYGNRRTVQGTIGYRF